MHGTSITATNLDIVRCFYDGLDSGEPINPFDYFSDQLTGYVSDYLPWGGPIEGLDCFKAMLRLMRTKISGAFEAEAVFAAGSEVVAVGRSIGFLNVTQQSYDVRTVHVWRFEDGIAVSLNCYLDSESPFSQLS